MIPTSWLFPPLERETAVRDALALAGNPWNKLAAMFAAPSPMISSFGRTASLPERLAWLLGAAPLAP
jgi:hypothetical protein